MKSNLREAVVSILIAVGYYYLSSTLGSIVNVIVTRLAGYRDFGLYKQSAPVSGLFLLLAFTLANHIFFGWVTSNTLYRYGRKHDCLSRNLFRRAAIAVVVLALVVYPIFFSNQPGWIAYVSHALAIELFGRAKLEG